MQEHLKVAEKSEVRGVADRFAARVCPHRKIQTDDGAESGEEHDVYMLHDTSLETAPGGHGHSDCPADVAQGQVTVDPGGADLAADRDAQAPTTFGAAIERPAASSHSQEDGSRRLPGTYQRPRPFAWCARAYTLGNPSNRTRPSFAAGASLVRART